MSQLNGDFEMEFPTLAVCIPKPQMQSRSLRGTGNTTRPKDRLQIAGKWTTRWWGTGFTRRRTAFTRFNARNSAHALDGMARE